MTAPRPKCVHCGKAYGTRHTETQWIVTPMGEAIPPYRGNGVVVKQVAHLRAPHSVSGSHGGVRYGHNDNITRREVWHGEWHGGYKPFCTLRCALDYARRAYSIEAQRAFAEA